MKPPPSLWTEIEKIRPLHSSKTTPLSENQPSFRVIFLLQKHIAKHEYCKNASKLAIREGSF